MNHLSEVEVFEFKQIILDSIIVEVDDCDFELVSKYKWTIDYGGYVRTRIRGKNTTIQRLIMNPPEELEVDHKDLNKLNNKRDNLRICTRQENARNRTYKEGTSKYKGVAWQKKLGIWEAYIYKEINKKTYYGLFSDEVAAANCYNHYAKEHFGEFALLNDCLYMKKEEWERYRRQNKSSEYRGVSFVANRWIAQIYHKNKNILIGRYKSEVDAAKEYNKKAIELKGEKARLNEIYSN